MLVRSLLAIAVVSFATGLASAEEYKLTGENTKIEFTGAKKDGKHSGGFKKVSGTMTTGKSTSDLKIDVTIDVDSMYSDDAKLTTHLKSPDFFEVKKFPEAKFVTTKVARDGETTKITGDLTMHGKTKSITFPVKLTSTATGLNVDASLTIDRTEWGIVYGKGQINNEVAIVIAIAAKK